MPPPESGHTLTEKQIDLLAPMDRSGREVGHALGLRAAEASGAAAARQPSDGSAIRSISSSWRGSIARACKPSPEADKETLLRRLTYDLTGLPPTPAEVDAFLADRSPDAYEKRVDALLQSPHYGERMAMPWLDAARYADTHGYHIDSLREMWPWRDWVIDAFNRNLPFDQFVIEQLAGDLLPNATREQKIASGFNRNHMINFEGGAIADEYQVEYVVDRVEATSSAFMGLTMGCARCHSHKFDPITHKEFYQFFAFFNTVPERGLDGRTGNAAPVMLLPSPDQQARLDELTRRLRRSKRRSPTRSSRRCRREWEKDVCRRSAAAPNLDRRRPRRLVAHYELDGNFSDVSGRYQHGRTIAGDPTFDAGQIGRAVSFDGDTEVSFGNVGAFDRGDRVQPRRLAEGPRQPADRRVPETGRSAASARLRVAPRRHRARRHPDSGPRD